MVGRMFYTDGLEWRSVPNTVKEKTIEDSLLHTLQTTRKIKRRTKALNRKLKTRTGRKPYTFYVKSKTSILRCITDNEDTEDDDKDYSIEIESSSDDSWPNRLPRNKDVSIGSSDSNSDNDTDHEKLPRKQKRQKRRTNGKDKKKEGVSNSSFNSDFDNDTDFTTSPKKQKSRKRKNKESGSDSSVPLAKRKLQKTTNVPGVTSVDHYEKQEKCSMNTKRNLISYEDSKDDSSIISESIKINKKNSHEFQRNTKRKDSAKLEKLRNNNKACENTESASDIISLNRSAISDDIPMRRSTSVSTISDTDDEEESKHVFDDSDQSYSSEDTDYANFARKLKTQEKEKKAVEKEEKESTYSSIYSSDSDSANDTDCAKLHKKQKNKKRKNKATKAHSSAPSAEKNLQENKNVPQADSVDRDRTQKRGLVNAKRNLTSLLDDVNDDNTVISESIEIDKRDSHEFRRNTELKDAVQFESFDNTTTCENTEFVPEKMSISSDAESPDKPTMRSNEAGYTSEEEEKKEEDEVEVKAEDEVEEKEEDEVEEKEEDEVEEKEEDEVEEKEEDEIEVEAKDEIVIEEKEEDEVKKKEEKEDEEEDSEEENVAAAALNEEEPRQQILEETPTKKSQPVITSTQIVCAKYTIVRDESGTTDPNDTSHIESPILGISRSSRGNTFSNGQEASPLKNLSSESRRAAQRKKINLVTNNSSDSQDSQNSQDNRVGVNKTVDLVSPVRKSFNDFEETRQQSRSQIIDDPSDSEELKRQSCSQIISDPSDSEETARPSHSKIISESSNFDKSIARPNNTNHLTVLGSKSIRSQIHEQDNFQSSTPLRSSAEAPTENQKNDTSSLKRTSSVRLITNDTIRQRESWEKELENVSGIDQFSTSRNGNEENEQIPSKHLRPTELSEYVEREGLVVTEEISTITAKDLKEFASENGDEDIWLMEIPKSIITDVDELCGKTMALENGKLTINGTTYKTKAKEEKPVTFILRSRKKKNRFKTVNVDAVGCIVVHQEVSEEVTTAQSNEATTAQSNEATTVQSNEATTVQRNEATTAKSNKVTEVQSNKVTTVVPSSQSASEFCSTVPFPKNLKSRNPLLGLNPPNHMNPLEHSSSAKNSCGHRKPKRTKLNRDLELCFT